MEKALELLSFGPGGWGDELLAGLQVTVLLALATLPFGIAAGFLVALAINSKSRFLRAFGSAYTTIFRGLPELLTLFIVYYGGQILLQKAMGVFSDRPIEVSGFVAGVIALSAVFSAFAAEVFLGALRAIPKGQPEAAMALGLSPIQTLGLVIGPQIVRLALPGLSNLWLVQIKQTALVSVIALEDLMRKTFIAVGVTKQPILFYTVACLLYLVLAIVSSFGIGWIERWAGRGTERA